MFVVAVIALLAAIAVPSFLRARKRAQATHVLNDLRVLDSALDLYAVENNKAAGAKVKFKDLRGYLRQGGMLYATGKDIFGNSYGTFKIDQPPKVPKSTKKALSDVVGNTFCQQHGRAHDRVRVRVTHSTCVRSEEAQLQLLGHSVGIERETNRPNPVLTPYVCSLVPCVTRSTTSRAARMRLRASSDSPPAGTPSTAIAPTSSSRRLPPVRRRVTVIKASVNGGFPRNLPAMLSP